VGTVVGTFIDLLQNLCIKVRKFFVVQIIKPTRHETESRAG